MSQVDVLIPTYRRKTGLAVVLISLLGQAFTDFNVVISDQTEEEHAYLDSIEIQTLVRALQWHRHEVMLGLTEQRQFLLERSHTSYVQYLDDDVLLDPPVMQCMLTIIQQEQCGFVGCAATGLQFLHAVRSQQQKKSSGTTKCSQNHLYLAACHGIAILLTMPLIPYTWKSAW